MSSTLHYSIASLRRNKAAAHRTFSDHLQNYRLYQRQLAQKEKLGVPLGYAPVYLATARRSLNTWSRRYHSYTLGLDLLTRADKEADQHG